MLSTDYVHAIEKLAALGPELRPAETGAGALPPHKFTLDHIRTLLAALGSPERRFPAVLIAGTNGKGSTAATLASVANAAGLRTGLYTSPHLLRVNERIRVSAGNGLVEIADAEFANVFARVDAAAASLVKAGALPHEPSFFELLTAIAFVHFAEQRVELAVLEVGLGGRLDATNSVEPLISVVTDIGLDHMDYLGDTISAIAAEKAGILRQDGVLVTLSQHPEANAAIGEAAIALGVRGVDAARFLPPRGTGFSTGSTGRGPEAGEPAPLLASPLERNRYDVSLDGEVLQLDSPLAGHHQQRNLALAVAAAVELRTNHGFSAITNAAIEAGVRATEWPGRLEWFAPRSRCGRLHAPVLLDVAHNPAGAWTLRAALAQLPEDRPRTLLFSCLADKQVDEMARILLPLFDSSSSDPLRARDHVVLAPIQNPRAASVDQLLEAAARLEVPAHAAPHVPGALAQAEAVTPPEGVIVVTGSVYLVGELRALLLKETP